MRECIRRGLYGALLAGGLVAFGAGAASASDQAAPNEDGLLSGNGLGVSVEVPVTVEGNAVSVIGDSVSTGTPNNGEATGGYAPEGDTGAGDTQGLLGTGGGIVTGNDTQATVTAPVNVEGNAVSGVGDSTAGTVANSGAVGGHASESAPANNEVVDGSDQELLGTGGGIVTDNITDATVTAPVNVEGNAVSGAGDSATTGTPVDGGPVSGYPAESDAAGDDTQGLLGTNGIASGNTADATATAPINVGGNAISGIGDSTTTGTATNGDHEADGDANEEDGAKNDEADHEGTDAIFGDGLLDIDDGIVSDNNTDATVTAPVNASGNAISIIGDSTTGTATNGDHEADGDAHEGDATEGDEANHEGTDAIFGDGLLEIGDGIVTDNDTSIDAVVPVNVDGNAISVIGDSTTTGTATNSDHEADGDAHEGDATEGDEADGNHEGTEGESKEDGVITGSGDAVNENNDDVIDNGNAGQGGTSDDPGNADVGNQDDLAGATGNEDDVIDNGNASQGAVNAEFDGGLVGGNHDDGSAAVGHSGVEAEVDGIVVSAGFSGGTGSDGSSDVRDSASVGIAFTSSGSAGSGFEVINLSSAAEPAPLADTGADVTWALMMGALLLLTGVASFRVRRVLIMSKVD